MPLPIIAKLGAGALVAYLVSSNKKPAGPSSPSSPGAVPSPVGAGSVAQRMALVLASGDPAAIRFEAGRLRQEGYPAQAAELEREAARIDSERAAAASAGLPPPPVRPVPTAPVATLPPVVVQTPQGPLTLPAVTLPAATPAVTVQTPVGPVMVPSVPLPAVVVPPVATTPITITTPAGPVVVPSPPPLPVLAKDETLSRNNPGQTYSEKTKQWQAWLAWIGLLTPADVLGKYGPKSESATKNFQLLANVWLQSQGKPVLKVDGVFGNQTRSVAALAHPPLGTGATANYFGSFAFGEYQAPMAASPLVGVLPPMAPKPIEPREALAARVAHNLATTAPGGEDRNLIQLFQMQEGLKASGHYNPSTAAALALHGIIPPWPRAWSASGTRKSKANYRSMLLQCAQREPQRREEWEAAAKGQ